MEIVPIICLEIHDLNVILWTEKSDQVQIRMGGNGLPRPRKVSGKVGQLMQLGQQSMILGNTGNEDTHSYLKGAWNMGLRRLRVTQGSI